MEVNQNKPGNPLNETPTKQIHNSSLFPFGYNLYKTDRFGELSPFFVMETVSKDKVRLSTTTKLQTLSLKSPLMQNLKFKKTFANVPMEAILPLNWDKVFTNPLIGDDVPKDANSVIDIAHLLSYFSTLFTELKTAFAAYDQDEADESSDYRESYRDYLARFISLIFCMENFFSRGSVLNLLGYKYSKLFKSSYKDFDDFFSSILAALGTLDYEWYNYIGFVDIGGNPKWTSFTSLRDALDAIRDHPYIAFVSDIDDLDLEGLFATLADESISFVDTSFPFNFDRAVAYQIVCHHFFSNDRIDYIYSAETYRQYVFSIVYDGYLDLTGQSINPKFNLNGLSYRYDTFSGNVFSILMDPSDGYSIYYFALLCRSMFGFNRALKYQDYFTGAKSQPLAVGDTSISVDNNKVSVVDVTRNIQLQRYLNNVNRAGRKFEDYIKGIFGVVPAYDYHNPAWLITTEESIFGTDIDNTGADQLTKSNSQTSRLFSVSDRYEFEFTSDRPSIIIGINFYEINRAYADIVERQTMYEDRFDMFIPEMQFIGDQPIYGNEIDSSFAHDTPFAYQQRNMEYKQRVNQISGGFNRALPSWVFVAETPNTNHINPDFIRSRNSELDKYFISLTGNNLQDYFHFIVMVSNKADAIRPMAKNPQIL